VTLTELDSDDPGWRAFTASAPGRTAFHLPAWQDAIRDTYGCEGRVLALLGRDGSPVAGVPVLRVTRVGRDAWVALPFTDHVAPLAADEPARLALAEALAAWAGGRSLEVRGELPATHGWQPVPAGFRHLLRLDRGPEAVEGRLARTALRHVRSGRRAGLRTRVTTSPDDLDAFYRLHALTRRRLGVPVQPRRFVAALWKRLIEPGHGWVTFAETPAGEAAGAGLFLAHGETAIMKFSASDHTRWELKPNHVALWGGIEEACRRGCGILDFGRSEPQHEGLRRFKASWGAAEVPLVYCSARLARAGVAGPSRLRAAMAHVIRRSPVAVCRALGELLYPFAG
jgi:CelD/BcsL family acetyltransferase involved in cellulose biosynthesis